VIAATEAGRGVGGIGAGAPTNSVQFPQYEVIDAKELARRLSLPESWIRDQVRSRAEDTIPHLRFGKYVRFVWGSPELAGWIEGRIVRTSNSRGTGRVREVK